MFLRSLFETPEVAPATLYHVSPIGNRESIIDHGLLLSKSEASAVSREMGEEVEAGGIFFTNTLTHERPHMFDVWEVDVRGLELERDETTDHDHLGEQWWVCYEDISPDRLNLLSDRIITEAPIADFHHIGNFDKNSSFRNAQDRKLLTNPKAIAKMKSQWKHPSETFFNILLLNVPLSGTAAYNMTEYGYADIDHLEDNLTASEANVKAQVWEQVRDALDMEKANIIYTGNNGQARVPMTGWIMAHRLGHALQASKRRTNPYSNTTLDGASHYFSEGAKLFETTMAQIMKDFYGIASKNKHMPLGINGPVVGFMREVCKTRTAREKTLTRPYEVIYESLAQYMFTGKVTFNAPPRQFKYGPSYYNFRGDDGDYAYAAQLLEDLGEQMSDYFDTALRQCEGKIFIM